MVSLSRHGDGLVKHNIKARNAHHNEYTGNFRRLVAFSEEPRDPAHCFKGLNYVAAMFAMKTHESKITFTFITKLDGKTFQIKEKPAQSLIYIWYRLVMTNHDDHSSS